MVLQGIIVSDGPGFGDLQWRLATLPLRLSGLGIYCASDVSAFAFVASRFQTLELQNHILRSCGTVPMGEILSDATSALRLCLPDFDLDSLAVNATVPSKPQKVLAEAFYGKIVASLEREFEFSTRQKAVMGCLQSEHAKDFLLAISMEGLRQRLGNCDFEVGEAAKRAATGKMEKHEEACRANQHCFIPFSFDTFGFLEQQSVELLKRLQKVMDSNVMTAGFNEFVFRRIKLVIQKVLAAQLVARLS
ncbi:hypothetical protein IFM89_016037 [Coptis chinensis]|uniref:Uncharacterized protein n=1 Tax=Coptis chinensis TaxID=261450 RepID=A0A835LMD1_9MAGN|nr:hypothetical protein IFM89_016037 [Coptis chinensis]